MPDLNLLDDAGFEEEVAPAPKPPKKAKQVPSGGGGGKIVLVLLIVILVLGAAVYFLNQRGILKLWGEKQPVVTQVAEEPFPPMVQEQPPVQPEPQAQPQDSAQLALLDTTGTPPAAEVSPESDSLKEAATSLPEFEGLASMEGEYTVQVITFRERKQAEEVQANLQEAGYPAFVERLQMKNGTWYRVCIGKYPTREEARKAVRSFGLQLQTSYIIDKVAR